jgi:lysophospholipase L1-like esterase
MSSFLIRYANDIRFFVIVALFININFVYSQSITVTSPNGGEKWEANSTQNITWQSSNISKVKIEYSLSNGVDWNIITPSVDASLGKFSWTLPNSQSAEAFVRVSDVYNPFVYNISDIKFSIIKKAGIDKTNVQNKISSTDTIKIMPLGDSITLGAYDSSGVGYREILFNLLTEAGYNFKFIGSQESGLEDDPPNQGDPRYNFYINGRRHEGHGGWSAYNSPYTGFSLYHSLTTSNASTNQDSFLIINHPNIILFHIGTNDIGQTDAPYYDTPRQLSWELHLILDKIHNFDSTITVFLAQIINRDDTTSFQQRYQRTHDFDLLLQKMAIDTAPGKIVVVNMEAALSYNVPDQTDLVDGIHPKTTGYQKMAIAWFDALQNYYRPILTAPNNEAVNLNVDTTFTWNAPPAANISTIYQVQISTDSIFSNIVIDDQKICSNFKNPPNSLQYGTRYYWRVRIPGYEWSSVWSFTTKSILTYVEKIELISNKFELYQNYPNPFNPSTKIKFNLPEATRVKLTVYNIVGEEIITLINKFMDAGFYKVEFDGSKLPSETYIYKLKTDNFIQIKKMILLK